MGAVLGAQCKDQVAASTLSRVCRYQSLTTAKARDRVQRSHVSTYAASVHKFAGDVGQHEILVDLDVHLRFAYPQGIQAWRRASQ